jgi:hypothetical protein
MPLQVSQEIEGKVIRSFTYPHQMLNPNERFSIPEHGATTIKMRANGCDIWFDIYDHEVVDNIITWQDMLYFVGYHVDNARQLISWLDTPDLEILMQGIEDNKGDMALDTEIYQQPPMSSSGQKVKPKVYNKTTKSPKMDGNDYKVMWDLMKKVSVSEGKSKITIEKSKVDGSTTVRLD